MKTNLISSEEVQKKQRARSTDKAIKEISLFHPIYNPEYWWAAAETFPALAIQGPNFDRIITEQPQRWEAMEKANGSNWVMFALSEAQLPTIETLRMIAIYGERVTERVFPVCTKAMRGIQQWSDKQLTKKAYNSLIADIPREITEPRHRFMKFARNPWSDDWLHSDQLEAIHNLLLSDPTLTQNELTEFGVWQWRTLAQRIREIRGIGVPKQPFRV